MAIFLLFTLISPNFGPPLFRLFTYTAGLDQTLFPTDTAAIGHRVVKQDVLQNSSIFSKQTQHFLAQDQYDEQHCTIHR